MSDTCNTSQLHMPFLSSNSLFNSTSRFSLLVIVILVIVSNFVSGFLRHRHSVPPIVSQAVLGFLLLKCMKASHHVIDFEETMNVIWVMLAASMNAYMFVLGLEMEPGAILRWDRQAIMAYAGMLPTFIFGVLIAKFSHSIFLQKAAFDSQPVLFGVFATIFAGTASPLLTRTLTDLKISKSDIGSFAVAAAMRCDLVSFLLMTAMHICNQELKAALLMVLATAVQMAFTAKVGRSLMALVDEWNPEGKPINESLLVLSLAFVAAIYVWLVNFNIYSPYSAFLTGLFLSRENRIFALLIRKVNFFLTNISYPLLFVYFGKHIGFSSFTAKDFLIYALAFVILFVAAVAGKAIGSAAVGTAFLGLRFLDAVTIGLLLAAKGHPHVYMMLLVGDPDSDVYLVDEDFLNVFLLLIICIILYCPALGANIIKRARELSPMQRRALQWHDPSAELRMMLCLRGSYDAPSAINFVEISRAIAGGGGSGPGLVVYATDMVDQDDDHPVAAAVVQRDEGPSSSPEAMVVSSRPVAEMRKQIDDAIDAYLEELSDSDGVVVRRILAASTMNALHNDICLQAEGLKVSLILLPFHKNHQAVDGRSDDARAGLRYVNRMVLRHAPCSVGILVDRGFGSIDRSTSIFKMAMIFIGGKDDREALAYAGRAARQRSVKLTVIRFVLLSSNADGAKAKERSKSKAADKESELKVDDEYFAEFYEKQVVGGSVAYAEKYVANSSEAYATLKSLAGQYSLFIVGRGGRVNAALTVGMKDWEQCAELGPVGDILSGPTFPATTSVLIVQQHFKEGKLEGLDDEFCIL